MSGDRFEERHPAQVVVSFSRVSSSGRRRLFGSPMREHLSSVRLRVKEATRSHQYHEDSYHAVGGRTLIQVDMSAAQFAALLTEMNQGDGVPGTLIAFDGKQIEELPDTSTTSEKVHADFKRSTRAWADEVEKLVDTITSTIDMKRTLTNLERAKIKGDLQRLVMHVRSNVPFVVEQFERAAHNISHAARAEVDAFVTGVAMRLGVEELRTKLLVAVNDAPQQLDAGREDDR